MAPVLVPLRPSNEHILIVRVPGARDRHGCHSTPFIVRVLRAKRAPGCSPLIPLRPRVARAPFLFNDPSKLAHYLLLRGGLAWSPTAHVERPLLHRGGSVSTGDQPGHPSSLLAALSASCQVCLTGLSQAPRLPPSHARPCFQTASPIPSDARA